MEVNNKLIKLLMIVIRVRLLGIITIIIILVKSKNILVWDH